MKVDIERRCTRIWDLIAKRAFSPGSGKERASWLQCFTKSVQQYVDNPIFRFPRHVPDGWVGSFGCGCLDFRCEYAIKDERADFTMRLPESFECQYGIDLQWFACNPDVSDWKGGWEGLNAEDVKVVLDGMIKHPRCHFHIHKVHELSFRHEVRIGTGLHEPFLFLYQLRFQLALSEERRKEEMDRLRAVFSLDWLKGGNEISPSRLFGLVR